MSPKPQRTASRIAAKILTVCACSPALSLRPSPLCSLDSLPDYDETKQMPSSQLLQPGSAAHTVASRCEYRTDHTLQRLALIVNTDADVVDAFVHNDARPSAAAASSSPSSTAAIAATLTPIVSAGSVGDLEELQVKRQTIQKEM